MPIISGLLRANQFTPDDIDSFLGKLFFEGEDQRKYLERFGVLLFLSAAIATFGVVGESAATVIGAMIIAPLMTPIIATAAALVVGQLRPAGRATLVVLAGVLVVISIGFVLGWFYTGVIDFGSNGQIVNRVEPTVIDLFGALACGAAGAFAMSRDDVSDSLPGVAVSISLVPPLTITGLGLAAGDWPVAIGSLLLFGTNYLSILLAGGAVLALLGLSRAATERLEVRTRRSAFVAILIGVALVTVPLAVTSARLEDESETRLEAKEIIQEWLAETKFSLREIEVDFLDREVHVLITGPGKPPSATVLAARMSEHFDEPVEVEVQALSTFEEKTQPAVRKQKGFFESVGDALGISG
jgi:uncharacterized hydrophobic protein (TIGR00271 family)